MKKIMKIIWIVIAGLSGMAFLLNIFAFISDKNKEAIATDWMVLWCSLISILFAMTFVALLDDKK